MPHTHPRLSGIILMLQASAAFSIMALSVKLASATLPSQEIIFFRSLFGTLMVLYALRKKKIPPFGTGRKKLMVLRGICGFLALSLFFYTISNLPVGTAVLLNYTSPIFTALLAIIFLKERPGAFLIAMIVSSFCGVYLLIGDVAVTNDWHVGIGLLSAVFAACAYVLISAIKDKESPLTVIFYFTFISTIGSSFLLFYGFKWPDVIGWFYLGGVAIGSFYGQLWMTMSLRKAPASLVGPFSYLSPLLSYAYGVIFFKDKLSASSVGGAALIIASGSLISYVTAKKKETI